MKVKAAELESTLASQPLPGVVAVVGTEEFLRRDAVAAILSRVHEGPASDENSTRHTGSRSTTPEHLTDLFDDIMTPNLFGGHRSIVVSAAEHYLAVDADAWVEFLRRGWSEVTLILLFDQLDGRRKAGRALASCGWIVEAVKPFHRPPPWKTNVPPWDNPLNAWIVGRARRERLRLDPPTAHVLMLRVGTSLADLAATIERLRTAAGEGATVDRELVERHTPEGEESNLFELVDAFFLGDRQHALHLAREILHRGSIDQRGQRVTDAGTLLLQFIGTAMSRIRQLRELHRVSTTGGSDDDILRSTGIARFLLPRLKQQARRTPPDRLERLVDAFARVDADMKTGRGPNPDELLERLAAGGR